MRTPTRFRTLALAGMLASTAIAGASTFAMPVGATSVPGSDDPVVVVDAGSEPRVMLPGPITPGTTAHLTDVSHVTGSVSGTGAHVFSTPVDVTTTISRTSTVVDIASDGGATLGTTFTAYDFTITSGEPEIVDGYQSNSEAEELVGLPLNIRYDANRSPVVFEVAAGATATPAQLDAAHALLSDTGDDLSQTLPDEPVGVGATWITEFALSSSLTVTGQFTLVSIDADGVATIDAELTSAPEALDALAGSGSTIDSGSLSGSGTITVGAVDGFVVAGDFVLLLDLEVSNDTGNLTMELTFDFSRTQNP